MAEFLIVVAMVTAGGGCSSAVSRRMSATPRQSPNRNVRRRPVGAFSERRATQKAAGQRRRNQRGVGGSPCPWPDGIRQRVARAVARSGRDVLNDCRL
jgi:hypothetical protein